MRLLVRQETVMIEIELRCIRLGMAFGIGQLNALRIAGEEDLFLEWK